MDLFHRRVELKTFSVFNMENEGAGKTAYERIL